MIEKIRLQKYISDCGVLSRRASEEAIRRGEITVNGEPAEIGSKITPGRDEVRYKGRKVLMHRRGHTYIILNKPAGYVSSTDDPGGPTVLELLPEGLRQGLFPCSCRSRLATHGKTAGW